MKDVPAGSTEHWRCCSQGESEPKSLCCMKLWLWFIPLISATLHLLHQIERWLAISDKEETQPIKFSDTATETGQQKDVSPPIMVQAVVFNWNLCVLDRCLGDAGKAWMKRVQLGNICTLNNIRCPPTQNHVLLFAMRPDSWIDWCCQNVGAIKILLTMFKQPSQAQTWCVSVILDRVLDIPSVMSKRCEGSRPASNQSLLKLSTLQCHGLSQIQGTDSFAILGSCTPKSLRQMVTLYLCLPQFSNLELWKNASITSILEVNLFIHFIQPTTRPVTENSVPPGATGSATNGAVESSSSATCR